jgi:hypothetical protein
VKAAAQAVLDARAQYPSSTLAGCGLDNHFNIIMIESCLIYS